MEHRSDSQEATLISAKINSLKEEYRKEAAELRKRRFVIRQYSFDHFLELITAYGNLLLVKRSVTTEFILLPEDIDVLRKLYQWTTGDSAFEGDLFRGIMLIGKFGSGKSLLMEAWYEVLTDHAVENNLGLPVWYKSMKLHSILMQKPEALKLAKRTLFIDEFGRESQQSKHYGNDVSPIIELLMERYDNGAITHGTANVTLDTLSSPDIYGPMLGDRFKQMFNFIVHKGGSRR